MLFSRDRQSSVWAKRQQQKVVVKVSFQASPVLLVSVMESCNYIRSRQGSRHGYLWMAVAWNEDMLPPDPMMQRTHGPSYALDLVECSRLL